MRRLKFTYENNQPIVDESHIKYVVRIPLKKGEGMNGFKDWGDLGKRIVDKRLYQTLKEQSEGKSFSKACEDGFFVQRQVNDVVVQNRIRHVRCLVASNQGHVQVKQHITPNQKPYRQWVYAGRGDLSYACEYKGEKEVKYELYSISDITQRRKDGKEDIPQTIAGKKELLKHIRKIKVGEMVLLYKESPEELDALDKKEKSQRLYRIAGFEKDGTKIKLVKHTIANLEGVTFKSCDNFDDRITMPAIKMSLNKVKFAAYMP